MKVSVGVPAHNEEANIQKLLNNLQRQKLPDHTKLEEILVVADGTDRTVDIIKSFQERNAIVKLIVEEESLTKKFNTILEKTHGEILIVVNADTLPRFGTIARLVQPFTDEKVGSIVGRAVPINNPESFWGYIHHLIYRWNYLPGFFRVDFEGACSLRKGLIKRIPLDVLDYEKYIDETIRRKGYSVTFDPKAITFLKAPDNLNDFMNQRRRTFFMHLQTQRKLGIRMSRLSFTKILPTILRNLSLNPKKLFWFLLIVVLTAYCYMLACYDLWRGKSYFKWKVVPSTKAINVRGDV